MDGFGEGLRGGIDNFFSTMTIRGDTISGNSAAQNPGVLNAPLGVFLSVANYPHSSLDDLRKALNDVTPLTGAVSLMWDWRDRYNDYQYIANTVPLVRALGKKVFLQFNPAALGMPSPPFGLAPTFTDPAVQAQYLADVARLAALRPDYLNLGAEINILCLYSPGEYLAFAQLYQQAYALVKKVSPGTKVGVSYHNDVIFMYNQDNEAFINLMGPQDYIGFTVYPAWTVYFGIFKSIDLIPTDYFTRLRAIVPDKPIVFSEVGWTSGGRGNLADQAAFVRKLPKLMAGLNPSLVSWAALHDTAYFQLGDLPPGQLAVLQSLGVDPGVLLVELNAIGLFFWDGTPKASLFEAFVLDFGAAQPLRAPARPARQNPRPK